jgi:hypothetical protein
LHAKKSAVNYATEAILHPIQQLPAITRWQKTWQERQYQFHPGQHANNIQSVMDGTVAGYVSSCTTGTLARGQYRAEYLPGPGIVHADISAAKYFSFACGCFCQ